ncbi:MAG TPA: radical SAM protein [Firmicutes bacterium]|nr:radical SAM protein [Bacillota bacterium]
MNLLSQLIPKNFLVANIVDMLTEDPEHGVQKIYEMSKNFIKDPEISAILNGIKQYYDQNKSVQMYVKNMAYNTNKNCLNHCIQNIGVNAMWDGLALRQKNRVAYNVDIPHVIAINPSMTCGVGCRECPASMMVEPLMSVSEIHKVVTDGKALGIHCVIINGGDPFLYKELMSVYEAHKDIQFFVITPGVNFKQSICEKLVSLGNVIPFIVVEGDKSIVDGTSKIGLYAEIQKGMNFLKSNGILYGVVTPIRNETIDYVLSDSFVISMIRGGSRINSYMTSTESSRLSFEKEQLMEQQVHKIRTSKPYLTFHLKSLSPFIDRCVTGPYQMSFTLGDMSQVFELPQVTARNIKGKTLIDVLKEQKKN